MLKIRFIQLVCLLGVVGLLSACGGASPREQALEATVAALQTQISITPTIAATATLTPGPDWRSQFIGVTYPPLPEGWEYTGGAITFSNCAPGSTCASEETYAVSALRQIHVPEETAEHLLLFERLVRYESDGTSVWTVLDVLVGSEIGGWNWLWQGCRVGDAAQTDDEIVAFAGMAWRANHLTGRFEPISPDGLTCVDENAVN
jgi:hypothetical protein